MFSDGSGFAMMLFTYMLILFIAFLIGRELLCWYWKVNAQLAELKDIHLVLSSIDGRLLKILETHSQNQPLQVSPVAQSSPCCASCGKQVPVGDQFCPNCGKPVR